MCGGGSDFHIFDISIDFRYQRRDIPLLNKYIHHWSVITGIENLYHPQAYIDKIAASFEIAMIKLPLERFTLCVKEDYWLLFGTKWTWADQSGGVNYGTNSRCQGER